MKKRLTPLFVAIACILTIPLAGLAQTGSPFPTPTHGWNMGNTLEPPCGEGCWGGVASQNLINSVAANGFNAVRIPVAWNSHAGRRAPYTIDPAWMARVKQVVDWCYAANLTVVINCHWDGGWFDEALDGTVNSTVNAKVQSYWTQIATAFAGYDSKLVFQCTNEPDTQSQAEMAELLQYYQTFVNAVRAVGGQNTTRWLVLSGPSTASDKTYDWFNTLPTDPTPGRLAIDVHEYSPYNFTLMTSDQSWGNMFYFWGQGYLHPTRLDRNPTWGNEDYILSEHTKMKDKFTSQGIPVLAGEYHATKRQGYPDLTGWDYDLHVAARTYWHKYVHDTANSNGMKPFYWDTPGGLFDWTTGAVRDPDMIRALTGGAALPRPPSGGSCTASTTRVGSMVTTLYSASAGKKGGKATVTIVDNCGNPVAGATVTGDFTGDWQIAQSGLSGVTDASGVVVIQGTRTANGQFNAMFCVTSVVKSGLTYNPAANNQTCDSSN